MPYGIVYELRNMSEDRMYDTYRKRNVHVDAAQYVKPVKSAGFFLMWPN